MTKTIAIVGAGLSGSLAAVAPARAGHQVTLIDRHPVYPKDFRVEKIAGDQIGLLRRLGMLDTVDAFATPFRDILNVRNGRVVDRVNDHHYAVRYEELIAQIRAALPPSVSVIFDRVVDLRTSPTQQRIVLTDGTVVVADLLILATGMADVLRQKLKIGRRLIAERQSITFGFSLIPERGKSLDFEALTYYGVGVTDRIDYLSLFPLGEVMRANLFTFLDHQDPWIRELRRNPAETMHTALPGLRHFLGEFEVVEKVSNWVMDLTVAQNVEQDGVVLIGDAFQTSCPAAGTGVTRLLTDIDRLCGTYIPQWFETPGLGHAKVAEFYADPQKRNVDARAMQLAHYRRSLTIDPSLRWNLHRRKHFIQRRVFGWVGRVSPGLAGQIKSSARRRKSA